MDEKNVISVTGTEAAPDWFVNRESCERLDVRAVLAAGIDPLAQILARVDKLLPETILQIETPFDPLPLRRLLAGRGYASHRLRLSEDHWQVFFRKQDGAELPDFPDLPDFPVSWQDGILDMDLRGMMPPGPMVAVLKVIEQGQAGDRFTVWLDRDPIYLYPELAERHWQVDVLGQVDVLEERSDGIRARISREPKT